MRTSVRAVPVYSTYTSSWPDRTASWHREVPPRFRRRSTAKPRDSRCAARISPSRTCSVKFFDPTTTGLAPRRREAREGQASDEGRGHEQPHRGSSRPRALLQGPERGVDQEGEERGGDGSGQDQPRVHGGDAAEDVGAESARADGGRDGGRAHRGHRGDAHAGQDHGQGERQLDPQEPLAVGHAQAGRGLHAPRGPPAAGRRRCCGGWAGAHRRRGPRWRCARRCRR